MPDGYYLSEETLEGVRRVIANPQASYAAGHAGGGGARHVTFCQVTGGSSNPYTCTVYYREGDGTVRTYDTDARVREIDGRALVITGVYQCYRTGQDSGGLAVYLTSVQVTPGCGLRWDDSGTSDQGKLNVNVSGLAGCGLTPVVSSGQCATLNVNVSGLAGCGLTPTVSSGQCPTLSVNVSGLAGCGLQASITSGQCDTIQVNVSGLAGCGLQAVSTSGQCAQLTVKPADLAGCGLTTGTGCQIKVDPVQIAGQGLTTDTGCKVKVNTGCGLQINSSGAVAVKVSDLAGAGLSANTTSGACQLSVACCSGTITVHTGAPALSYTGNTLYLSIPTTTYGLQVVGGQICWASVGTGFVSGNVAFPCASKTFVTGVQCVSGSIQGTTDTVSYIGCSG